MVSLLGCNCDCTAVAVPVPGPVISGGGGDGPDCCGLQRVSAHALGGHRLVVPTDAGTVEYASAADLDHMNRPIWLTTGAWGSGVVADLTALGTVVEGSWSWTPGSPIWLGINGLLTQTPPTSGFARRVAEVVTPTTIEYRPHQPVLLI